MLLLTTQDLEQQGIAFDGTSQFVLHNTIFTKSQSFSQTARTTAIDMCQKYLKENIVCVMVDSGEQLTLWREKKERNSHSHKKATPTATANKYQNSVGRSEPESKDKNRNKKLFKFF